jgi:sulfate-transporting ATPase
MTQFIGLAIIGLCSRWLIALSAHGVVLIYRGSGVLNLAQAAMGGLAAFIYWDLRDNHGLPFFLALIVGVAASGVCGLFIHYVVLRPMRGASAMTKLVGTLAVLVVVQSALQLYFGPQQRISKPVLPIGTLKFGGIHVGARGRARVTIWRARNRPLMGNYCVRLEHEYRCDFPGSGEFMR